MKLLFSDYFKKQLKRLLSKYPNAKNDLLLALREFNTETGVSIGRSIYKIRIASSDIKKGKSGGFRAYLYLYRKKDLILPLAIYPKSATESITESELKYHFDRTMEEMLLGI